MRRFSTFASLAPCVECDAWVRSGACADCAGARHSTQTPAQLAPALRPAPPAPPALRRNPPAPFPQGAKIAFVDFQRVAQESVRGPESLREDQRAGPRKSKPKEPRRRSSFNRISRNFNRAAA